MRKIFALCFTLTLTLSANAQNDSDYTFLTPFDAICTTRMIFAETITRYGEVPIMRGKSLRNVNGALVPRPTVLFMNMQTGSWTMAEQMSEDAYCVTGMGQDWEVYRPGVTQEPATRS